MKFKFRLQPLLILAQRRLKLVMSDVTKVSQLIEREEASWQGHQDLLKIEDRDLERVDSKDLAMLFFQRRQAQQERGLRIRQRIQSLLEGLQLLQRRQQELQAEIYRLEKAREQALANFQKEVSSIEAKNLDEMGIFRHGRSRRLL